MAPAGEFFNCIGTPLVCAGRSFCSPRPPTGVSRRGFGHRNRFYGNGLRPPTKWCNPYRKADCETASVWPHSFILHPLSFILYPSALRLFSPGIVEAAVSRIIGVSRTRRNRRMAAPGLATFAPRWSTVIRALWVTMRYWIITYDPRRRTFTEQYEFPELPLKVGSRYRGFHRFDLTTCIACEACAGPARPIASTSASSGSPGARASRSPASRSTTGSACSVRCASTPARWTAFSWAHRTI